MELRQVRYFIAVIDTGSFTAAASALTIVQSAVSQQISRLERDLGVDLFDRTRRQFASPPPGGNSSRSRGRCSTPNVRPGMR